MRDACAVASACAGEKGRLLASGAEGEGGADALGMLQATSTFGCFARGFERFAFALGAAGFCSGALFTLSR